VGQVFVAVAPPAGSNVLVREHESVGDRAAIRRHAVRGALELLAEALGMPTGPGDVEDLAKT
jgi:nicotinamide mononucleotide (NMN) deamidase PncC